jgi:hypothetical protein
MTSLRALFSGIAFASACLVAQTAGATLITFEDQPPGPDNFAAAGPAQTLVYTAGAVTATFTGGVILTNETSETTDFNERLCDRFVWRPHLDQSAGRHF